MKTQKRGIKSHLLILIQHHIGVFYSTLIAREATYLRSCGASSAILMHFWRTLSGTRSIRGNIAGGGSDVIMHRKSSWAFSSTTSRARSNDFNHPCIRCTYQEDTNSRDKCHDDESQLTLLITYILQHHPSSILRTRIESIHGNLLLALSHRYVHELPILVGDSDILSCAFNSRSWINAREKNLQNSDLSDLRHHQSEPTKNKGVRLLLSKKVASMSKGACSTKSEPKLSLTN